MDLMLTERGETTLQSSRKATQEYLKRRLSSLSEAERTTVVRGMRITRQVFSEKTA
jgi:hypothetical protein